MQSVKRTVNWTVGGVRRFAWVYLPAKTEGAPLVFVWHGHAENPPAPEKNFALHLLWPEAVVVYPQGLRTPGRTTDPEGKLSGWQFQPGMLQNRDIAFYDAMLKTGLEEWRCDKKAVFSSGISNGARLTYILWALRGDTLAGVAPIAATADGLFSALKPKPCFQSAGQIDTRVPFDDQKKTMEWVRKHNGCQGEGVVWAKKKMITATYFPSSRGTPFVECVYAGGHEMPKDAPPVIVKLFKQVMER